MKQVRTPAMKPADTAKVFDEIAKREPWAIWDPAFPDADVVVEPAGEPTAAEKREILKRVLLMQLTQSNFVDFMNKVAHGNLNFECLGHVWVVKQVSINSDPEIEEDSYVVEFEAYGTGYSLEIKFSQADIGP